MEKTKEKKEVKVDCPECKGSGYVMPCQAGNYAMCTCNTCRGKGKVTEYK